MILSRENAVLIAAILEFLGLSSWLGIDAFCKILPSLLESPSLSTLSRDNFIILS